MASLYSNENFPRRVVDELRLLGNDVLTSYEAGRANLKFPDDQVLAFATGQQRAVITLNRLDFIRLHRDTQGAHAGIVVCTRGDADPATFAHRIHSALSTHGNPTGQLIRSGGAKGSCILHLRNMQELTQFPDLNFPVFQFLIHPMSATTIIPLAFPPLFRHPPATEFSLNAKPPLRKLGVESTAAGY